MLRSSYLGWSPSNYNLEWIWLPKIFTRQEFGSQISSNIVKEIIEVESSTKATYLEKPSVQDDLRWKKTFSGRQPLVEDNLHWKMTFSGSWPSVESNLQWKTTFGRRWPLAEDNLHLTVKTQLSPNRNCCQLSQPEIEFAIVEKCMRHYACTYVQRQRRLNLYNIVVGMAGGGKEN